MARPFDWSPLAPADPVPGDPAEVAAIGARFGATAAEIHQCCARLRSMCTGPVWESDAGQAFRSHCDDSATKLSQAFARYDAAAQALGTSSSDAAPPTAARPNYAGVLGHAQDLSLRALTAAQEARQTQQQSLSWLHTLYGSKPSSFTGLQLPGAVPGTTATLGPGPHDNSDESAAKRRYNAASEDLDAAQQLLNEAIQLRDTAATYASALITDVIDHDGLGDTFWDHVTNLIDEHAGFITAVSHIAGWIATACGTLALLVGWIPIIGQALAAMLGTIALIASVVQLMSDILLEIGGKGSLFDLALDVIAVASFGLGRAAVGAVRDSALLARFAGRLETFQGLLRDLMTGDTWLKGGEEALEEEIPAAWKMADESVGVLQAQDTEEALAHGSAGWPRWGGILRGFNPASILKDGFTDIGDLKLSNWTSLASRSAWNDARFFVGDPEIHAAIQGLGDDLASVGKAPAVHAFLANVDSNREFWQFATVPAVTADYINHFMNMTGLRDRFLDDAGLGWAR